MQVLKAGALYFTIVFAAGFLLGPIHVLWIEPKAGPTLAVLCESPFLLAVMILAARWVPGAVALEKTAASLITMGIIALALQQAADFLVGVGLRGIPLKQQVAHFGTKAGMVYATLLILFAIIPLVANPTP
jgi:hypothetical protein